MSCVRDGHIKLVPGDQRWANLPGNSIFRDFVEFWQDMSGHISLVLTTTGAVVARDQTPIVGFPPPGIILHFIYYLPTTFSTANHLTGYRLNIGHGGTITYNVSDLKPK